MEPMLPEGVLAGHWTHPEGLSGCSVVLVPGGATGGVEVRGGGPGTRETDVLSPASGAREVHGFLLTGGSAFGLAAAGGVVDWLEARGHGHLTRAGVRVPLVPAAVVFDRGALHREARPGAAEGRAACDAARPEVPERGRVGAGASTAAGKLGDPDGWTPTGFGAASARAGDALVTALAVANPVGEVLDRDGTILAGARRGEGFVRSLDLLREGIVVSPPTGREATVLVVVLTDARLGRRGAWLVARAASAGVARAVEPVATTYDGDVAFCLATGDEDADSFVLEAIAADVAADAVRDAARSARGS
jgi:L-aminopeptidase/D-esterase-like protein